MLIPKASDMTTPQNYHPITCLNIVYKLWTSCMTIIMNIHCENNHIMHPTQKGCSHGQQGCVDHLLLTNLVYHQVRRNCRSLSVAWVDYRKAFDSVPHNWILECLNLFQFPSILIDCLRQLIPL